MIRPESDYLDGKEFANLLEKRRIYIDLWDYWRKGLLVAYTKDLERYTGQDVDVVKLLRELPPREYLQSIPEGPERDSAIDAIYEGEFGRKIRNEIRKSLRSTKIIYRRENIRYILGDEKFAEQDEPGEIPNHEGFIRNLRIYFESNLQIRIQEHGKEPLTPDYKTLDFRNETTREWRSLVRILEEPPHRYYVSSDAERKILGRISKKLINFFNRHCEAGIPDNYSLFERCPNSKPGTYRLKMQVIDSTHTELGKYSNYINLLNDQLLDEIKRLSKKYLEAKEVSDDRNHIEQIEKELKSAVDFARLNRDIPIDEITDWIKEDKEDIRYDPYES